MQEKIFQIGPITAPAEAAHTIPFSPIFGRLLVGGGVRLLAFAARSKKN